MKNEVLPETLPETSSLEPLFADLVRRGLPVEYARRSVDELDDHRADLLAEFASEGHAVDTAEATATERLGSHRKLARKIAGDFHRRSFAGRWPLMTFLLGPPALLAVCWAATMLAMVPVAMVLEQFGVVGGVADGVFSTADRIVWHSAWFVFMITVPGLLAILYTKIVRRSGMHVAWAVPALLMIGLLAGNPSFTVNEERQVGMFSLGIPGAGHYFREPTQAFQLLTPICLGIAMLAWGTWQRRKMVGLDGGPTVGPSGAAGSMTSVAA